MKQQFKIYFTAAAVCSVIAGSLPVFAAQETAPAPIADPIVEFDAGIDFSKQTIVDYPGASVTQNYRFANSGKKDLQVHVSFPGVTTLADPVPTESLFTVSDEKEQSVSYDTESYFGPLTSMHNSGDIVSSETICSYYQTEPEYSTQKGTLYSITKADSDSTETAIFQMKFADSSDRIYPVDCSYNAVDDFYELTSTAEVCSFYVPDSCSVTLTPLKEDVFTVETSESTYGTFLSSCVDSCLKELDSEHKPEKEELLILLERYLDFNQSGLVLDVQSTAQWLTQQKLYLVERNTITVPAGQTITLSIPSADSIHKDSSLQFDPRLLNQTLTTDQFEFQVILPDTYVSAELENCATSWNAERSQIEFSGELPTEVYTLKILQESILKRFQVYILPLTIGLIIFLGICILAKVGISRQEKAAPGANRQGESEHSEKNSQLK